MKKEQKKYTGVCMLIYMLVLLVAFGTAFFIRFRMEKQKEAENTEAIYQMLGELERGVSHKEAAANIMKGNIDRDAVEEGMTILLEYGYGEDYHSVFTEQTKAYVKKLAVWYLLFYLFLTALFFVTLKLLKKGRIAEYHRLENILEQFYGGKYEVLAENLGEETESLIFMRLESLGKKIELNEQRIEKEKEETKSLVTDLSHQLKTPVASIKMCFQLLEDEQLKPEERKEFLNRLGEQIIHLEGLLQALVNISRMEAGMIEIIKEKAEIFATVVQAVNQVYMKAEEKEIEIVIDEDSSEIEQLSLPHDVKWTKEAVVNVLENAIKYSPVDSTIRITLIKQTHFLRIEIKDEGIGIKKEEINRIFHRFYRGKNEMVKQVEGSGVGLYLTRKILEEQGGNISVVLAPGKRQEKGSTFAIMLPLE